MINVALYLGARSQLLLSLNLLGGVGRNLRVRIPFTSSYWLLHAPCQAILLPPSHTPPMHHHRSHMKFTPPLPGAWSFTKILAPSTAVMARHTMLQLQIFSAALSAREKWASGMACPSPSETILLESSLWLATHLSQPFPHVCYNIGSTGTLLSGRQHFCSVEVDEVSSGSRMGKAITTPHFFEVNMPPGIVLPAGRAAFCQVIVTVLILKSLSQLGATLMTFIKTLIYKAKATTSALANNSHLDCNLKRISRPCEPD